MRSDRKSTRLNSSHGYISYAVFCLKKKKRVVLDLPSRADVPAQQQPAGRLIGQHPRPTAYAPVNPAVVEKAADLQLEHGLGDRDLEQVVLVFFLTAAAPPEILPFPLHGALQI